MRAWTFGCLLSLAIAAAPSRADAGWFEAGDTLLRNDLLLLNDAEVIRLPVNQWPMPRAAVRFALEQGKEHLATNKAVQAALERVRMRLQPRAANFGLSGTAAFGEASLLRDFDSVARDGGELRGYASWSDGERAEISLSAGLALDAEDGQELRADGSHATVALGNWLLSAQNLDRWWGPGRQGSLILSNNARPMPSLLVERATARPFVSPWLSWLGPWRFNFGVGRMEDDRQDIDAPLFMAWRVTIMPFHDIEIGFSRTAQFCGRQLTCDVDSFFNMLAGNDNVGFDSTPETEPGNQMAGFDMRWASPLGNWPYAVYGQMIGEDESSYLPAKYLAQFGLETWKPLADGGLLQFYTEYADTTCSAVSGSGPYYNCAYNQGLFNIEGYRFHGRTIGHTTDRDSRSLAVGATLTTARGDLWSATLRGAELNRDGNPDATHSLTELPADYGGFELQWRGTLMRQALQVELGLESMQVDGFDRETEPYGFVRWTHSFRP
jgi:hypothetical protein